MTREETEMEERMTKTVASVYKSVRKRRNIPSGHLEQHSQWPLEGRSAYLAESERFDERRSL